MGINAIRSKKSHKYFYRNSYRAALSALLFSQAIIIVLAVAVLYVKLSQPEPDFYATSSDGKLVFLKPLAESNKSDQPLIQ